MSDAQITMFMCGPSKCKHDWGSGDYIRDEVDADGNWIVSGWTAVCTKCGVRAIDEAMWV